MSYQTFKAEVLAGLTKPHTDKMKPARILATAYHNLILRHIESLTGGGVFLLGTAKLPGLIAGFHAAFTQNLASANKRVNIFQQLAPYIYTYWAGNTALGALGVAIVSGTGSFSGPIIPESNSPTLWLDVFIGVIAIHLKTITGTYTNYVSGATTPWSGVTLLTFP